LLGAVCGKKCFKFKRELLESDCAVEVFAPQYLKHNYIIPSVEKMLLGKEMPASASSVAVPTTFTLTTAWPFKRRHLFKGSKHPIFVSETQLREAS